MVGRCHETLGVHDAGILDHGDPGADGDRDLLAGEDKGMAGHGLPHAFGDDAALDNVGASTNDGEFLTAHASEHVLYAHHALHGQGHLGQDVVARWVAVAVVDVFEVVHIEGHQRE